MESSPTRLTHGRVFLKGQSPLRGSVPLWGLDTLQDLGDRMASTRVQETSLFLIWRRIVLRYQELGFNYPQRVPKQQTKPSTVLLLMQAGVFVTMEKDLVFYYLRTHLQFQLQESCNIP